LCAISIRLQYRCIFQRKIQSKNTPMLEGLLACAQRISQERSPGPLSEEPVSGTSTSCSESIRSHLGTIRAIVQTIQFSDLALPCSLQSLLSSGTDSSSVQFFEILNEPSVSVCLISFPPGSRIPLHDHPGMHVFTKLIAGQLNITTMDVCSVLPRAALPLGTCVDIENTRILNLDAGDFCELSPVIGNIHGVSCRGHDTALMLDVNIPPYSDDSCHYFGPTASSMQLCVIDEMVAWGKSDSSVHSSASTAVGSRSSTSQKDRKRYNRR
jgi:cysteamine dioxygenase